ncbi:MAG: DUF2490 domain-containing protein [Schleiferiaceae bacterium]|nr:DUF2490 domain-containing protein [Schleiferiaceae bacterium]
MRWIIFLVFAIAVLPLSMQAQLNLPEREVNHDMHTWISVNSFTRISDKWGMMVDVHHRRREGIRAASFDFMRLGATYWFTDELRLTAGGALLRLAPPFTEKSRTNEWRFHHELTYAHKIGKVGVFERLRFDHRWREQFNPIGQFVGYQFSTRIRFLYALNIPIFKGPTAYKKPTLSISDELLVQYGPGVVYNFFEQNRFFLGIRQRMSSNLSFDTGYMYVFQQTAFGSQLNAFHTFRLFFYYTPDLRKNKGSKDQSLPVENLWVD